jgi:hypothetical protein
MAFFLDAASTPFATDANGMDGFKFAELKAPVGAHQVVAKWSGASVGGTQFPASASPAASLTVVAPGGDVQSAQTSIAASTLQISTPYTSENPLVLPAMTVDQTLSQFFTSAAFTGITVGDSRTGNLGWSVSAVSSEFAKVGVPSPSALERINAQNVGLTGLTLTSTSVVPPTFVGGVASGGSTTGQNLTGFDNPAAAHLPSGVSGALGLGGTPKTVLHANQGRGTTVVAGTLSITAPTNTADGTYRGTITFTVIGS